MPAYRRFCPYDDEADLLEAWCRRHGIDALALFNGRGRVPEIWRDDGISLLRHCRRPSRP